MMAWDKFSEYYDSNLCKDGQNWECYVDFFGEAEGRSSIVVVNPDRRRAMCECMVKSVS